MTTLDELERLARAATPGPWIRSGCRRKMGDEDCIMVGPDGFLMAALPIGQPRDHAGAFNDAAFIAAANPATILALLSERAELLATVERLETALIQKADEGMLVLETLAALSPNHAHRHVKEGLAMARQARAALTTGEEK